VIAAFTALCDRWYYGMWTFPPLRFLNFNITQSLAVFYGKNRPDYYLTEAIPLLLMAMVPFLVIELYQGVASSFRSRSGPSQIRLQDVVPRLLTWTTVFMIASLSVISHKEARFIYPLLSPLHLFVAAPLSKFSRRLASWKSLLLSALFLVNIAIAVYTSRVHQRGVIDVMDYLRSQHETKTNVGNTTVAFLMPCHSTPWRSHLIHPEIDAWALTCEPPVNVPFQLRNTYIDEADLFYREPLLWLKRNMHDISMIDNEHDANKKWGDHARSIDGRISGKGRPWPEYLVFFQHLEPQMKVQLKGTPYRECWRGFNTQWHDDWRRQGDVVVWCME